MQIFLFKVLHLYTSYWSKNNIRNRGDVVTDPYTPIYLFSGQNESPHFVFPVGRVWFSSNGRLPALRPTSALPRTMDLFDKPMLCSWRNRWDSNSTKRSTLSVPERMFIFFKFFLTKIVHLDCSKVYLIKAISNTKKELYWEGHAANQMFG